MLERAEVNGLRWLLGITVAGAALFSVIGIVDLLDPWVYSCLGLLIVATGVFLSVGFGKMALFLQRILLAGVLIHAGVDVFLYGSDFLPPVLRTLVLLLSWRAVFQSRPSASGQVAILALVLILLGGFIRPNPQFGLILVLYSALVLPLLWLQQHAGLMHATTIKEGRHFEIRLPKISALREASFGRVLVFTSGLYLLIAVIAALFFVFLPRLDYGQSLNHPQVYADHSQIGFTESLRFGDISNVLESSEKVMRIDTSGVRLPGLPYWRMLVLDEYQTDGFGMSEDLRSSYRELVNHRFSSGRGDAVGLRRPWIFYMEGGSSRFLPVPGSFAEIRMPSRQTLHYFEENLSFALAQIPSHTFIFRVDEPGHTERFPGPDKLQDIRRNQRTLELSDSHSQEILGRFIMRHELQQWSPDVDPDSFASSLIEAIQEGRGYSLEVQLPRGRADPLLRWLDAGLSGHCEFYAGATVMLARALGAPARLVVGYIGGDWNGFEDYYMIRKLHAHAWVEIWHPETGWARHEPTPITFIDPQDSQGGQAQFSARGDRSWEAYIDSLRFLWYQRVVRFDSEYQGSLRSRSMDAITGVGISLWEMAVRLMDNLFSLRAQSIVQLALKWIILLFLVGNIWLFRGELSQFRQWLVRRFTTRDHWEQYIRSRADRLLRKYPNLKSSYLQKQLLRIRYGPMNTWPEPLEVFREARLCAKNGITKKTGPVR